MKRFILWLVIGIAVAASPFVIFGIYGHYLVDYSLDSLGLALEVSESSSEAQQMLTQKVKKNIVRDLVVEEGARGNVESSNLALLEAALRSYDETGTMAGKDRGKMYLKAVTKSKNSEMSFSSKFQQILYETIVFFNRMFVSAVAYVQRRCFPQEQRVFQISNELLLRQAGEQENAGKLAEAGNIYKKYLELYATRPEWGFVALSYANILSQLEQWDGATAILKKVQRRYFGRQESKLAANIMRHIDIMRRRASETAKLAEELSKAKGQAAGDLARYRLALSLMSSQKIEEAQANFEQLKDCPDLKIRNKARFFLGWICKMSGNLDKGAEFFQKLAASGEIDKEMLLSLHVQLADIYYRKGDLQKAKEHYQILADSLKKEKLDRLAAMQGWLGLAAVEQNLVFAQLGETQSTDGSLDNIDIGGFDSSDLIKLRSELEKARQLSLRDEAFRKLMARQVYAAMDLFEKYAIAHPKDGWTFSGLATCYLMSKDLKKSEEYANLGYTYDADEYTAALLAYIDLFSEKFEDAISLNTAALTFNQDYIPARYNLAYAYLKTKENDKAFEILKGLRKSFKGSSNVGMRARVLNNLGVVRWRLGDKQEALGLFEKAIKIKPGFLDAQANLTKLKAGQEPRNVSNSNLLDSGSEN